MSDNLGIIAAIGGLLLAVRSWANKTTPGGSDAPVPVFKPKRPDPSRDNTGDPFPNTDDENLDDLYLTMGKRHGVEPELLKAIAIVESSERPWVQNPSDPSYGLFQILCVTDRSGDGRRMDQTCQNKLYVQGWSDATPNRLLNSPTFNAHIGAQILAWNIRTYGRKRGVAVYNSWSSRKSPPDGPFPNQGYVDKVQREYGRITGGARL